MQLGELQRVLRSRTTPASMRQRSELIWLLAGGASLAEASEWVGLHYTNAHIWTRRFLESGLAGLTDRSCEIRPTSRLRKGDRYCGHQGSRGAAQGSRPSFYYVVSAEIAGVPGKQPGLEGITRSTIRRRLHQEGFHFYEGQTWCESHDPEFESKKTKS